LELTDNNLLGVFSFPFIVNDELQPGDEARNNIVLGSNLWRVSTLVMRRYFVRGGHYETYVQISLSDADGHAALNDTANILGIVLATLLAITLTIRTDLVLHDWEFNRLFLFNVLLVYITFAVTLIAAPAIFFYQQLWSLYQEYPFVMSFFIAYLVFFWALGFSIVACAKCIKIDVNTRTETSDDQTQFDYYRYQKYMIAQARVGSPQAIVNNVSTGSPFLSGAAVGAYNSVKTNIFMPVKNAIGAYTPTFAPLNKIPEWMRVFEMNNESLVTSLYLDAATLVRFCFIVVPLICLLFIVLMANPIEVYGVAEVLLQSAILYMHGSVLFTMFLNLQLRATIHRLVIFIAFAAISIAVLVISLIVFYIPYFDVAIAQPIGVSNTALVLFFMPMIGIVVVYIHREFFFRICVDLVTRLNTELK